MVYQSIVFSRSLALLGLLACWGCGTEDSSGRDESTVTVVLGTGSDTFEAIESEPTLTLIKGLQGGFHIWTSFLVYGFETDVVRMELSTRWEGVTESIIEMDGNVAVFPAKDPAGVDAKASVGWPALIYNPTCAHGKTLRFDITVRDMDGNVANDIRRCIADVPEADRSSDCAP